MNNTTHAGIIFDMDGVLVDSADAHWLSWRQLVRECGASISRSQFQETFGLQNRDIIGRLLGEVDNNRIARLADRKEAIYRDIVRNSVPAIAGAAELVRELNARGVRLAVGSSGPRANIDLILQAMNIEDAIGVIVSSEIVQRGKPAPDVFQIACERLKLPPNRCAVVEDAPAGIQAAKSAGCAAVAVLMHHPKEAFRDADLIVEHIGDLSADQLIDLATNAHRNP